jgi:hypothetical protein
MPPQKTKKTMTYDVGNSDPGLGQTHKCGGVWWDPNIPLWITESPTENNIYTNDKK